MILFTKDYLQFNMLPIQEDINKQLTRLETAVVEIKAALSYIGCSVPEDSTLKDCAQILNNL